MLYDQGMILDSEEYRLYANFKYNLQPDNYYEIDIKCIEVSSYDQFDSECNATMVGFVQNKKNPGSYSCFFARKLDPVKLQTE